MLLGEHRRIAAELATEAVRVSRRRTGLQLLRDAPVVVSDEPTVALDARAEQAVLATLRGLTGTSRITVLVTHRLADVRHAGQILVLERGKLIERGRHDDLMAARGVHHELFSIQAQAYS